MNKKITWLFMSLLLGCGGGQAVLGSYTLTGTLTSGTCESLNLCPTTVSLAEVVSQDGDFYNMVDYSTGVPSVVSLSGNTINFAGGTIASPILINGIQCVSNISQALTMTPKGKNVSGLFSQTFNPPCDGSANTSCTCVYNLTGTFVAQ